MVDICKAICKIIFRYFIFPPNPSELLVGRFFHNQLEMTLLKYMQHLLYFSLPGDTPALVSCSSNATKEVQVSRVGINFLISNKSTDQVRSFTSVGGRMGKIQRSDLFTNLHN